MAAECHQPLDYEWDWLDSFGAGAIYGDNRSG